MSLGSSLWKKYSNAHAVSEEPPTKTIGQSSGYLDSAATRDEIHQQKVDDQAVLTHNPKIFQWGLKGGRTKADKAGDHSDGSTRAPVALRVKAGAVALSCSVQHLKNNNQ